MGGGGGVSRGQNKAGGKGNKGGNKSSSKSGGKNGDSKNRSQSRTTTKPIPFNQIENALEDGSSASAPASTNTIECPVCCDTKVCAAIGVECGHWACYTCQLRIRDLSTNEATRRKCPMCKTENKKLVFTKRPEELLSNMRNDNSLRFYTQFLKIRFDEWGHGFDSESRKEMQQAVEDLYSYKCWTCDSPAFRTLWDLEKHLEKCHNRFFCRTCLDGREIFLSEQMCYSAKDEVDLHFRVGDQGLVPIKPHCKCDFCDKAFFSHEALYQHMRYEHITCFLCYDKRDPNFGENFKHKKNEFFANMTDLYNHYVAEHHVCRYERCMREGIFSQETVFASEAQLATHMKLVHKCHNAPTQQELDRMRPRLDVQVTSTAHHFPKALLDDAKALAAKPQVEKPIFFMHIPNPAPVPPEVILPDLPKQPEENRYPDMYGIGWKDFDYAKHKKKLQNKAKQNGKAAAAASNGNTAKLNGADAVGEMKTNGAENQNGIGHPGSPEPDHNGRSDDDADHGRAKQPSPDDSDEDDEERDAQLTRTYLRTQEYETEMQDKMIRALQERAALFALPPAARIDTTIDKSSFLHAVDAVLEASIGTAASCKARLMAEVMRQAEDGGAHGKVNIPEMKQHVATPLSPLSLDSLSEMRNYLLKTWDARFNTDLITGLRPLFFRTLRGHPDGKNTANDWLAWKYQAHVALNKFREVELDFIRIYVSLCLERNVAGFAGVDRAKAYPSLEQSVVAAAAKDADVFNPEATFQPDRRGAFGSHWQNRGGLQNRGEADFPSLGGGGGGASSSSARGPTDFHVADPQTIADDGTPLLELTMAERLKLQEQRERAAEKKKKSNSNSAAAKMGGQKAFQGNKLGDEEEFPAFPVGLQPLGGTGPPVGSSVKKPLTKAAIFGAPAASVASGAAGGASSSSAGAAASASVAKAKPKVGLPNAKKDITLNSVGGATGRTVLNKAINTAPGTGGGGSSSSSSTAQLSPGGGANANASAPSLADAYGKIKVRNEDAERGQVAKTLGNPDNFPALLPGKSRDTGGLLKGANIISKKTGTVLPVANTKPKVEAERKRDLFDDDDDFADVSFAQALATASSRREDSEPPSPLWKAKRDAPVNKLPTAWDDEELFPSMGLAGTASASSSSGAAAAGSSGARPASRPLVGKAKQIEEARKRQEAKDARLAKQLQESENAAAAGAGSSTTGGAGAPKKGRQKKTLIAWG